MNGLRIEPSVSGRRLNTAITLGIVLEALEILRRAPRWFPLLVALLVYSLLYLVYLHPWWAAATLATLFSLRLARRRIARPRL